MEAEGGKPCRRFGPHGAFTTIREICARTKAVLKPPHSKRSRVDQAARQSRSAWCGAFTAAFARTERSQPLGKFARARKRC